MATDNKWARHSGWEIPDKFLELPIKMPPRAPIQVGINPTMAVYTIFLGGACALAAYTEKYRRDQDEIDDRLKERYSSNMREQHDKMPQITQAIRGQDMRLDGTMNKWVWGGKAALPVGGPTGRGHHPNVITQTHDDGTDEKPTPSKEIKVEEEEDESQLSNKERKRRRKERKQKRIQQRAAEQKQAEAQRQKLVLQSVAAGAAVGAVAVAVSVVLGNGRK